MVFIYRFQYINTGNIKPAINLSIKSASKYCTKILYHFLFLMVCTAAFITQYIPQPGAVFYNFLSIVIA